MCVTARDLFNEWNFSLIAASTNHPPDIGPIYLFVRRGVFLPDVWEWCPDLDPPRRIDGPSGFTMSMSDWIDEFKPTPESLAQARNDLAIYKETRL
jgi:hypothetical protein